MELRDCIVVRTLKAAFVCGALATSIAGFLFTLGAFGIPGEALFGHAGATPQPLFQWLGALVLGFGLAWTTVDIETGSLQGVVAALALLEAVILSWLLHLFGVAWPPFTALTAGVLATAFGLLYNRSPGGLRKRLVRRLFGGRISARTERLLIESREPLDLAGERVEASVVVCEIFNRQLLSETLSPKDYVALANAFLKAGAEALMDAGGLLDECNDQQLRAIFGAPLADPDHAVHACAAANALGRRLEAFCKESIELWKAAPDYRIGIDSGELIAAAYGVGGAAGYRVAGEALEFCRRLCVANQFYGSRVLVGPRAFQLAAPSVEVRPMELIRLPGRQAPEEIYELLAPKDALTPGEAERRDLFWKGVILFRERRWDEAEAYFQTALHGAACEDAPVRFYLDRIAHAREGAQALDWDTARL